MSTRKGVRKRTPKELLSAEGHTVGALVHGGVTFVSADQDTVQSAVVCILAVVSALMNGAFNALICLAIHVCSSFFRDRLSMTDFFLYIPADYN